MLVKICGNKTVRDIVNSAAMGADFCGILVGQKFDSTDFVSWREAHEMANELMLARSSCTPIMVTHEVNPRRIVDMAAKIGVRAVQLHGYSTPEQVRLTKLLMPEDSIIIKAIHVTTYGETLSNLNQYMKTAIDYYLLDTKDETANKIGGTGKVHDWSVSARIVKKFPQARFILAGGLDPENVGSAIHKVGPVGVDINSGTKGADGKKDIQKIQKFIMQSKNIP